jgi:hypothetical protein
VLLFTGCTGSSPQVQTRTPFPTPAVVIPSPILTVVPFTDASGPEHVRLLREREWKGFCNRVPVRDEATRQRDIPVMKQSREQAAASQQLELQNGYNRENPGKETPSKTNLSSPSQRSDIGRDFPRNKKRDLPRGYFVNRVPRNASFPGISGYIHRYTEPPPV